MSSKNIVKRKGLLAQVNNSARLTESEMESEIECPRCYDSMTLCSDFDSLRYFCEQCGFLLHT
jgi:ribosomal protein S27AE